MAFRVFKGAENVKCLWLDRFNNSDIGLGIWALYGGNIL